MVERFFEILCCPCCKGKLKITCVHTQRGKSVLGGELTCSSCSKTYPIENGIPRFVPKENYAHSFGWQWNLFSETQLDSKNGTKISEDRFFKQTQWARQLKGEKILEAGCGMGRFTEVALSTGADCYSLDYSNAVNAAQKNMNFHPNHCLVQGSIYEIPFPEKYFDKIFCFGVLQHTPSPEKSFQSLVPYLKPGGMLVIDAYAAPISWFHPRQFLRPFTKRMNPEKLYKIVQKMAPALLKISNAIASIPKVGNILRHGVPIANYKGRYPLTEKQVLEWAILDTFDWLSPHYEQPQLKKNIERWFKNAGFKQVFIERNVGIYVARAVL